MKNFPVEYFFITKNGTSYYKAYNKKKVKREIDPYTLASIPVIFDNDCTINSIFKLIENNPQIKPVLYFADDFLQEAKTKSVLKEKVEGKIRFAWDYIETDKEYVHVNYPMMRVDGVDKKGEAFGIEFLKACDIKNVELMFDTTQHVIDSKGKEVVIVDIYPTLFQVVYGLFWELSFFGSPSQRDEQAEEIFSEVKKFKTKKAEKQ